MTLPFSSLLQVPSAISPPVAYDARSPQRGDSKPPGLHGCPSIPSLTHTYTITHTHPHSHSFTHCHSHSLTQSSEVWQDFVMSLAVNIKSSAARLTSVKGQRNFHLNKLYLF